MTAFNMLADKKNQVYLNRLGQKKRKAIEEAIDRAIATLSYFDGGRDTAKAKIISGYSQAAKYGLLAGMDIITATDPLEMNLPFFMSLDNIMASTDREKHEI